MIERWIVLFRLLAHRLRARCWGLRGVKLGAKVCVGPRSRIDFASRVTLGPRVTVESDVWIKLVDAEATLHVGEKSFLGRGTELDVLDRVTIGEKVLIAPRVFITDHSHKTDPGSAIMQQGCEARSVTIGDDVWIGTGAVILAGVTIGDGAVVGAGAVVRHDVPGNEIWAGVPAKKIRNRKGDVT